MKRVPLLGLIVAAVCMSGATSSHVSAQEDDSPPAPTRPTNRPYDPDSETRQNFSSDGRFARGNAGQLPLASVTGFEDGGVSCDGCDSQACSPAGCDFSDRACDVSGNRCECRCNCDSCEPGLFDNLSVFMGLEGSKQPQEFGVNAQFGGRMSVNWGIPLARTIGLGLQIGSSINYTDNAVQVYERVGEVSGRSQSFTTVGFTQQMGMGVRWGAVYDFLFSDYYSEAHLGQWRFKIGQALDPDNEFGVKAMIPNRNDSARVSVYPVRLEPIAQGSLYWRHTWESEAETSIWFGAAKGFGQRNLAFEALLGDPVARSADERFLFGAEIHAPLNDHFALFGQANFLLPADTGTVDAYLGVVYYFGGGAKRAKQRRYAPVLDVANSTSFAVDLR